MTKPALAKPRILFIFASAAAENSTHGKGFVTRLKKYGDMRFAEAEVMALEDLVFIIDKRKAKVLHWSTRQDPADFDFVYFKSWQAMTPQAVALAIYLRAKAVPYIDPAVDRYGGDKLATTMRLWAKRIPTLRTVYASTKLLPDVLKSEFVTYPAVIKSATGQKGQNNFLVKNASQAKKVIQNIEANWLVQDFVPNTGDWRVQVYGGEPAMVIKRTGSGNTHLNNTSAGGTAKLIDHKDCPKGLLKLATRAAETIDLAVAGVDVIIDKNTGRKAILEVNQGSQIVTGVHIDKNIPGFVDYLRRTTSKRYHRKSSQNLPKKVIGRIEVVGLPEFGIADVAAKTDTGAYSGALHAENIRLVEKKSGQELHFQVPHFIDGRTHSGKFVDCISQNFEAVQVKSSNGQWQDRYKIRTIVRIQGKNYNTQLTLTDRQSQKVPMLLGRKLLRGNFLVNVELSRGEITKA
jgi:glutathione synthase/RimK-type ligase-like ATP-grasp enzyme